jgi:hypothetical protein
VILNSLIAASIALRSSGACTQPTWTPALLRVRLGLTIRHDVLLRADDLIE